VPDTCMYGNGKGKASLTSISDNGISPCRYLNTSTEKKIMGEGLRCEDNVHCRHCDFEIDRPMIEDSRVSATLMKTNCVQFRQSVRPNRTVSCLGTNMKKYATCENCVGHSLHPRLREYLFGVENDLLTWSRAVGSLADSTV